MMHGRGATFKYDESEVENIAQQRSPNATFQLRFNGQFSTEK